MRFRTLAVLAIIGTIILSTRVPAYPTKTFQNFHSLPTPMLEFPPGVSSVRIPVRIVAARVIVRVRVGERDMDFVFDSGASGTYLNRDVFKSLNLGGDQAQATSTTATLKIGDLTLRDVTVVPNPISYRDIEDTAIVGLIGSDLIRNAVVRLDYDAGTLEVMKPSSFTAPANASVVPVRGGLPVPFVTATIGDVTSDDFILDTGSWAVVVFERFANAHPELFNKNAELKALRPRSEPICGRIMTSAYQVSQVGVGTAPVAPNWDVLLVPASSCFNINVDGLIGYDYLRLFTVTFDMPESRVYLELSKKYAQ